MSDEAPDAQAVPPDDVTPPDAEVRAFERGAWFAFDHVLGWLNTLDVQVVDKKVLYHAVMDMRPAAVVGHPVRPNIAVTQHGCGCDEDDGTSHGP